MSIALGDGGIIVAVDGSPSSLVAIGTNTGFKPSPRMVSVRVRPVPHSLTLASCGT